MLVKISLKAWREAQIHMQGGPEILDQLIAEKSYQVCNYKVYGLAWAAKEALKAPQICNPLGEGVIIYHKSDNLLINRA